jgi:hypothetical protein
MRHVLNGVSFKFGLMEMREFAKQSDDVRVKIMMLKIDQLRSKLARWNDALLGLEAEIAGLKQDLEASKNGPSK